MARISKDKRKNILTTVKKFTRFLKSSKYILLSVIILSGISGLVGITGSFLLRPIINNYIVPGDVKGLGYAVIVLAVIYLSGALSTLIGNRLMVRVTQKIIYELRMELFHHVDSLPLSYYDANSDGNIMSYFTNDIDTIENALNSCFSIMVQSFVTVIGSIIMMFVLNVPLTLFTMVCFVVILFIIYYNSKVSKQYYAKRQQYSGDLNGYAREMMEGQKVEKVFGHEMENLKNFRALNEDLRVASTKAFAYSGVMTPMVVSIGFVNYTFTASAGGIMVIKGLIDLGTLASYLIFVRQFSVPVNQFTQQMNLFLSAVSGMERIFTVLETKPEIDEGKITLSPAHCGKNGEFVKAGEFTGSWGWETPRSSDLSPLKGDVRFHDVTFGYDESKKILNGINLYAKPGQKIAFVGSTGAGKTTIINLINRFYEISGGQITYDGIDIRDIRKKDLRQSLSLVLQDTHLFTGTIADNIRYGNLDATDEEVRGAAMLSNADSFIRRLPDGYNTMIKNDGDNLSLGQRQLLAIARAAVANPPVLILDEATSSIDTRTEELVEAGMDAIMKDRTVFVIAHRLSTVHNANAILVLDHGHVVERGTHDELLKQKGRYYKLYHGMMQLT